jgi:DNA invertase Pin-like site-specific DNA recombinase
MLVGYARVSTLGQSFDGQIEEPEAAGCTKVFREKMSGVRSDRPQLRRLLKALGSGEVLVITRLDRLARSTRDLLNILEDVRQAGAGFRSLHDTWCDTSTPHGQLMLTVLGGLAEFERALTKARIGEGRKRARAAGVRFGRPFALTDHQQSEAIQRLLAGEAVADIARSFNVERTTIYRLRDRHEAEASETVETEVELDGRAA